MSLKNVDINYGFNGEPSTASISSVVNVKSCGAGANNPISGNIFQKIETKNEIIDSLLADFVVITSKESKDAGYETKTFELVDKYAKKLESIPVLIRGITASPKGDPFKFYGKVYYNSETGLIEDKYYGDTNVLYRDGIIIMGRTFSVVTAQLDSPLPEDSTESKEEAFTRYFATGEIVGQAPKGVPCQEIIEKFNTNETSVALKYGYYLEDLKSALQICGYELFDFPDDADKFIILDTGGTLKDCVSTVAAMYGLYWNCRGIKIKFYPSEEIFGLSITNFNSSGDVNILSSSFSTEGIGKRKIGIISGTTANEDFPSQFGGNSTRGINISFGLLRLERVFSEEGGTSSLSLIKRFLSFFRLCKGSENTFDLLFWAYFFSDGDDIITKNLYKFTPITKQSKTLSSFAEKGQRTALAKKAPHDGNFFSLAVAAVDDLPDGELPSPSKEAISGFLKAVCSSVASIYISKPVSKLRSQNYSIVVQDGFSVSPPYKHDITIDKIDGLSELAQSIKQLQDAIGGEGSNVRYPTIKELYLKAQDQGHASTNLLIDGYYFVATRDFFQEGIDYAKARAAIDLVFETTPAKVPTEFNGSSYLACGQKRAAAITKALASSFDLYENIVLATKKTIKMKAFKIKASDPDPDPESNEKDLELYKREIKSFQVVNNSTSDLSSVEYVTFDGSIDEAKYISSNFQKLTNSEFQMQSSSVTYMGLQSPNLDDPLLDSVSLSFSNGSVETTMSYSKKDFLGIDQNILLAGRIAAGTNNFKKNINSRQKNFLGVN